MTGEALEAGEGGASGVEALPAMEETADTGGPTASGRRLGWSRRRRS